jgi:hypothetical protein
MLLELVPGAPSQFSDEISNWQHESYEEHFSHSGFRDKDLAIVCYRNAPQEVRRAFDSSVADLEQEMVMLLQQVQAKIDAGDTEGLTKICCEAVPRLQELVHITAGIVNGSVAGGPEAVNTDDTGAKGDVKDAQSAVDALFD